MPALLKDDPFGVLPTSLPSTLTIEDDEYLSLSAQCPRKKRLPRDIQLNGGQFVSICLFRIKRGQGDKVMEQFRKVHQETDERELSVYSHRVMRGLGEDDSDQFCIVMEYDNPEAFYTHWMNIALQDLVNSNVFKSNRPKMSFFRELDS